MAVTVITAANLKLNTPSASLPDAGGGAGNGIVATTPTDGWEVRAPAGRGLGDGNLVFRLVAPGSGDTFTVVAGDRPPGQRADLGDMKVVLAASNVRFIAIDTARFMRTDGTILITATAAASTLTALLLPRDA